MFTLTTYGSPSDPEPPEGVALPLPLLYPTTQETNMQILKPKTPWAPPLGDIHSAAHVYVQDELQEEDKSSNILLLRNITPNTWRALTNLGISHTIFKEATVYTDIYTETQAFYMVPTMILCKDPWFFYHKGFGPKDEIYVQMQFNSEFAKKNHAPWEISEVESLLMGSGYQLGTFPDDGDHERILVKIPMDHNNTLVCWSWLWFNK